MARVSVRKTVTAVSAAVITVVLLSGCGLIGGNDQEQAPDEAAATESAQSADLTLGEGTFTEPSAANRQDVDSTAQVAAEVIYSWDTALDSDRLVALQRAAPLLEDQWAREAGGAVEQIPVAGWSQAYDHDAYAQTTVEVAPNDVSRDYGPDRVSRQFKVGWEWVGRDGERAAGGGTQVTVYLERDDSEQWSVVGHHDSAEQAEDLSNAVTGQDAEPPSRSQDEAPEHEH